MISQIEEGSSAAADKQALLLQQGLTAGVARWGGVPQTSLAQVAAAAAADGDSGTTAATSAALALQLL
jgi:hypothetical protein